LHKILIKKMKNVLGFIVLALYLQLSLTAQHANFPSLVVDYGTIERNTNGEREFPFMNDGDQPLIISNAQGSCGCTIPTWPKEPIEPGQSSSIKAKYDTNRLGQFTKTITLTTNSADDSQKTIQLTIKGNVIEVPQPDLTIPGAVFPASPVAPVLPATPVGPIAPEMEKAKPMKNPH